MGSGKIMLAIGSLLSTAALLGQPTSAQVTYTLKATPKTVAWGYYDAKAAPVFCPSHK
jgi:hypothetical protein